MPPLRVLIAERAFSHTGSWNELLADYDDIEVVGCAQKAIETLMLAEKLQPDVVLLDIPMPGETLAFVLDLLKKSAMPPTVVVLIPYASSLLREHSIEAGADHVFAKTNEPERLIQILEGLTQGRGGGIPCI
jgi:DNA-binding NarL/FixJ family response regulator